MIKGFNHDIREWLRRQLNEDIRNLQEQENKGRPGTKASINRQAQIEFKKERLERLNAIGSFVYNPNGENRESNSLNHTDVISICSAFISNKELMRWILVGRFPFLLIDESQDANQHLLDALFVAAREHSSRFSLGLIGDSMQRIYTDGKARIEDALPEAWGKPSKKLNHRCPKRVIRLINKIRGQVDAQVQEPKSDAIEGYVRFFIRPVAIDDYGEVEDTLRNQMAEETSDAKWNERDACKILMLEHHMSANRLGFENIFTPLYTINRWRTGLLDGTFPPLQFFTEYVLPLVKAQRDGNRFLVSQIMRANSPLLKPQALKEASDPREQLRKVRSGVEALLALWKERPPNCGEVLLCVSNHGLFDIPDSLQSIIAVLQAAKAPEEEIAEDVPDNDEMDALLSVMKAPFKQVGIYREYVSGSASFDTHQGVKGLEFERVMVVMNDSEARGFMFDYGKILGDKNLSQTDQKNISEGKDSSIDRTRRLLYVTCSRAKQSLALVAYCKNPEAVKKQVIRNDWFTEKEIVTCPPRIPRS